MPAILAASALEAYERWSRSYPPVPHNPLMQAEQDAMLAALPDVRGRCALDLACGTGRYASLLAASGAEVIALDFAASMLERIPAGHRVRASMMQLPFVDGTFDLVICGLALGHATSLRQWVAEISRVLKRGGCVLYSDFHPEAARAGLTRSFKDDEGRSWTVPHTVHEIADQRHALAAADLTAEVFRELRVGEEFKESFTSADAFYRRWAGLPLLMVVRARK